MILVDTDVLIDALKGVEPARTQVARGLVEATLGTTAVNAFELYGGVRTDAEARAVEALLAALAVLPVDLATARIAGALEKRLSARGAGIGEADALIAGVCLAAGASLLTRNRRHFERVPGLHLLATV